MADNSLGAKVGSPVVLPTIRTLSWTATDAGLGGITSNLKARQIGDKLHISGRFTCGTPTGVTAAINLPSGCTISSAHGGGSFIVGKWTRSNGTTNPSVKQGVLIGFPGNTLIQFGIDDTTGTASPYTAKLGTDMFSTSDVVSFDGELIIPITEFALTEMTAYGAGLATTAKAGLYSSGNAPGSISGSAIAAGMVGETIESSVPSHTMPSGFTNVASISLTTGVWDVTASVCYSGSATNTNFYGAVTSVASSTSGTVAGKSLIRQGIASGVGALVVPPLRVIVPAGAAVPYYLNIAATSADATTGHSSYIRGVRVA